MRSLKRFTLVDNTVTRSLNIKPNRRVKECVYIEAVPSVCVTGKMGLVEQLNGNSSRLSCECYVQQMNKATSMCWISLWKDIQGGLMDSRAISKSHREFHSRRSLNKL